MKLTVQRFKFLEKCTIGHLLKEDIDTGFFTLEDKMREEPGISVEVWKINGETAIPRGIYRVGVSFSDHFQKDLPILNDVPGFVGVRIHPGNIDSDTEGCILVGKTWLGADFIGQSREAFNEVFSWIKETVGTPEGCEVQII